jgi:hypothetical protein
MRAISGVIFAAGQDAAEARLGALGELELDGAHGGGLDVFQEALHAEVALCSSRQPK